MTPKDVRMYIRQMMEQLADLADAQVDDEDLRRLSSQMRHFVQTKVNLPEPSSLN